MATATALRCAARKLGGRVLQRWQAAVVVEEPRLISGRSRSTSSAASNNTESLTAHEQSTLMAQVQEKKEALFRLIAKSRRDGDKLRPPVIELLLLLSAEIKPKPYDCSWRVCRSAKRYSDFAKYAGTVAFGYMIVTRYVGHKSKVADSTGEKGNTEEH